MESKLIFSQFEPVKLSNEIVNFNQDPFKEIDIKPADPFDEEEDNIIYDGEDIIYNDNNILLNPFVTKKDSKSSSFKEVRTLKTRRSPFQNNQWIQRKRKFQKRINKTRQKK